MKEILETPRLRLREMALSDLDFAARHAFQTLRLPRVVSLTRPANLPSQGVARKLGMAPEREVAFHGFRHILFSVRADGRAGAERPRSPARAPEVS